MSAERLDVVFYDSGVNVQFANALVDTVVIPAYFTALENNQDEDLEIGDVIAETEVQFEDCRIEYEFLAQQDEQLICIVSTSHRPLEDLTEEGARLIYDDIQASSMPEDLKDGYQDALALLQKSVVIETFVRRSFCVRLVGDKNEISVRTQAGYSVNGIEVAQGVFYDNNDVEPALQRDTVFEVDEILEIIRCLLVLDFIKEEDVKHFLDQDF